ncbi:MAG: substrate-binding domain-containing protein [Planctomycetaceae bacterium]|nr:substrate-binding domain-containing protein [Planctomycetaceae bacterium]
MKKKTCAGILLAACALSLLIASLVAPSIAGEPEKKTKGFTVGVLVKMYTDMYIVKMHEAMFRVLDEYVEQGIVAEYTALDANLDVLKQLNNADDLIAKKVDLIIMCPAESTGCAPIVDSANAAGIPIVVVNAKTDNVEDATAFVGSDDVEAGRMMGDFIIEKKGPNATVLHLMGIIGNSATTNRGEGIMEAFSKANINILDEQTGKWNRDEGMRITEDWIQRYPKFDAIVSDNDEMAVGAVNALMISDRKKDVVVIGVDATDDALVSVKNGELDATILQDAVGQGEGAARVGIAILTGQPYEKNFLIPFTFIDQSNVDEFLPQ